MTFRGASNIDSTAGFTIDLGRLNGVQLSDDGASAKLGPGSTWREVYEKLEQKNRTVAGGRAQTVGVGGFLLGGGISFLSYHQGLGSDNVLAYEVVLASSEIVHATLSNEYSDLFWALKLGSRNFGIVTSFTVSTFVKDTPIYGGTRVYDIAQLPVLVERLGGPLARTANEDADAGMFAVVVPWSQGRYSVAVPEVWLRPRSALSQRARLVVGGTEREAVLLDTRRERTVSDMTVEIQGTDGMSRGSQDWFTLTYRVDSNFSLDLFEKTKEILESVHELTKTQWALTIQLFTKGTIRAGQERNGGNPLGWKEENGDLFVVAMMTSWPDSEDDELMRSKTGELREWAVSTARSRGILNDFIYMNYADDRQEVYEHTVGTESLEKMIAVRNKYDPKGVLATLWRGGFKLPEGNMPTLFGPELQTPLRDEKAEL